MSWKYLKIIYGRLGSTETNPYEINILAGATQCQIGGTIESDRAPMYSTLPPLIDGNFTTATYWGAGAAPTVTVTMPIGHTDLTRIEMWDKAQHTRHTLYLSQDKVEWTPCPYIDSTNLGKQQNFGIPALPQTSQNFTANGSLNFNLSQAAAEIQTVPDNVSGQYIRYIRDHLNGSDANEYSHWVEIQAISNGVNVALGKEVTSDYGTAGNPPSVVTDGDTNTNIFYEQVINNAWVYVDLGAIYDVEEIKVWHYINRTYHETITEVSQDNINWITIHDSTIDGEYYETDQGHTMSLLTVQNPQDFIQNAVLNIGLTENVNKVYTANHYTFAQWSLNFLDYYFYTDQIYTPRGYARQENSIEALALTETAIQDYTANGYEFMGADSEQIILNFDAAQEYTPEGYNFATSTQENINIAFIGAQAFTAEGYDRATMAQENILLVMTGAQVYTAKGYNYEATTSQLIDPLSDAAAQEFAAHFEQTKQEIINLSIEAAQSFTAHFEQVSQLNFALNIGAAQEYTANGYINERTATETIQLNTTAAQVFAAHFEQAASEILTLSMATNIIYQANFTSLASQNIFIEDLATATAVFSDGLQFQENAQENIILNEGAAQTFTAFGGYEFNQSGAINFGLTDAAASFYELGETGKYTQRVTYYLYLQEDTQTTYTRNWLDFEATAAESMGLSFGATSEHLQVNIFEANAAESFTWYINPLSWYGEFFGATTQENIGLSILATNERTEKYLTFEMNANDFFYFHYTDIAIHEVVYLTIQQNMFYDFLFWDYADSVYTQKHLTLEGQATEIIDLSLNSAGQYTNANWINSFATENIGLTMAAVSDYTQTQIYSFIHFGDESIGLSFGAVSEHILGHIGRAVEPIDFEHWANAFITTEPRNYEELINHNIKLKIVNWVYFESDIYVQTYKIEITKPNTMWEPTEQDRPLVEANQRPRQGVDVSDTIFSGANEFKVDRRILNLTDIDGPTQITYASEIKKPSTLYTNNNEIERGLMDD